METYRWTCGRCYRGRYAKTSICTVSFLRRSDNQLEQSHSVCGRSNWLEHSQTSITPAAESKCAVYSDLLHISIYSIFLLIEVCGGCTLKLTVSSAAEMDRKQNTSNSYTS